jgi:hypothetical protein
MLLLGGPTIEVEQLPFMKQGVSHREELIQCITLPGRRAKIPIVTYMVLTAIYLEGAKIVQKSKTLPSPF